MKYQKIINLLENEVTQPSKFRTKNWVQINDDARGRYKLNSRLQCWSQFFVIIGKHIYMWRGR